MTDIDRSIRLNREKRELERRALVAVVEAKYGRMPPSPIRQPGETDEMFIARLKEWRNSRRVPVLADTASETAPNTTGCGGGA
jgi:hypothetical protein